MKNLKDKTLELSLKGDKETNYAFEQILEKLDELLGREDSKEDEIKKVKLIYTNEDGDIEEQEFTYIPGFTNQFEQDEYGWEIDLTWIKNLYI